jgi:PiT family inorganic phosphate transporter
MLLLLTVLLVALVFEYINGFHDTANAIATVVSTKVLTPRQAIVLAATTNLVGAIFLGTAVAKTISSGLVNDSVVQITPVITVCALLGAIIWNLITWWLGLPSSSSHALVGGLCGAVFAAGHNEWTALIWAKAKAGAPWYKYDGLVFKVIIPMFLSPVIGLVLGFLLMTLLYVLLRKVRPRTVNSTFGSLQLISAGAMGLSHGQNDAQKTMGIVALTLVAATKTGQLDHLPAAFSFLRIADLGSNGDQIPNWIKIVCALTMAAGTAAGGWRIIRTMGHKMVKLQPVHGFAAETAAATVLYAAGQFGMPVSTTHVITSSIMGVGAAKRFSALRLSVVERILWAWMLTLPITALLGYSLFKLSVLAGG